MDFEKYPTPSLFPPETLLTAKLSQISPSIFPQIENGDFYKSSRTLKQEMQQVASYLSEFKPSQIMTPFKGTSLLLSKDKTKFYFGSREGRIAIAKIENKEIMLDVDLKEGTIWTIAMYDNDKYLFSGGQGGLIKKFLIENMSQIDVLIGHTNEVNVILISSDEKTMFSTGDDSTVLK